MTRQSTRHAAVLDELVALLVPPLLARARVRVRGPFAIGAAPQPGGSSKPQDDEALVEPDLAVIFPGRHSTEHPASAFLVVEVVDAADRDVREAKRDLYAAAGVMEYWVVDVAAGIVESYRSPAEGRYRNRWRFERGDIISLAAFPDVILRVADFLA